MDQLNEYLQKAFANKYNSAKKGESFLLIGRKANFQPLACLYSIPYRQDLIDIELVKYALLNNHYYILSYQLSIKLRVPFITIVFPSDIVDEENARFILSTDGFRNPIYINSESLEQQLLAMLSLNRTQASAKAVNKYTTDFFHIWSRNHLPSGEDGIIKCDLDGLFFEEWGSHSNIVVEIKRSAFPRIPFWRPYRDDFSGLIFLSTVAHTLGFKFWIMHHEGSVICPESEISIFDVDTNVIDESKGLSYNNVFNPISVQDASSLL